MKEQSSKTIKQRLEEEGIDLVGELITAIDSGQLTAKEKADKIVKLIDLTTDKNESKKDMDVRIFIIDYRDYDKDPDGSLSEAFKSPDKYAITATNKPIRKPS